jgi:ribonuclease P protein component
LTHFLCAVDAPAIRRCGDGLATCDVGYTRRGRPDGRRIPKIARVDRVQANVSAEQSPSRQATRLPRADAHAGRPRDPRAASLEGPRAPVGVVGSTNRTDVARALANGRAVHGERVVVFVVPGSGAAAFVAGRRVGGAVSRNRARRILRAAWRALAPRIVPGHDVVLVARASIRGARSPELVAEVERLLSRAQVVRT